MSRPSGAIERVLVIGSEGFIGQHVVREFGSATDGYQINTADIIESQAPYQHWLLGVGGCDFEQILTSQDFDLCINCSGAASVGDSNIDPLRDYELNVANVARILDAVRKAHGADCRFLNLSSAAVYGCPPKLPITEETEAKPISPYGLHKLQAEQLVLGYVRLFGLRACSVRIFSAYGRNLRKQLFWDLYRKATSSETVELWGTGGESRDFIEVSDLARALRVVCEKSEFSGESVNVASGTETSIESAVRAFLGHFDSSRSYIFNGKVKEGDPRNWWADISSLRSMGFEPSVSMEQGLKDYVNWLRSLPA